MFFKFLSEYSKLKFYINARSILRVFLTLAQTFSVTVSLHKEGGGACVCVCRISY